VTGDLGAQSTAIKAVRAATSSSRMRGYYKVVSEFQSLRETTLFNSTQFNYDLWEYLASLTPEGSTILVSPSDLSRAQPEPQLVLRYLGGTDSDGQRVQDVVYQPRALLLHFGLQVGQRVGGKRGSVLSLSSGCSVTDAVAVVSQYCAVLCCHCLVAVVSLWL